MDRETIEGAKHAIRTKELAIYSARSHGDLNFYDFTLNGDTAIVYYNVHRTALPDGTPTDQYFQNIHVWVYRDGAWKIFGGMARGLSK